MSVPYENATSGAAARGDILKVLERFGCNSVGFMDRFQEGSVLLAFEYRGRQIQIEASGKGWADMYLREHPWNHRRHSTPDQHREKAYRQGMIAINSVLRDWIKGQLTAIECGMASFHAVFLPYTLIPDGRTVAQALESSDSPLQLEHVE